MMQVVLLHLVHLPMLWTLCIASSGIMLHTVYRSSTTWWVFFFCFCFFGQQFGRFVHGRFAYFSGQEEIDIRGGYINTIALKQE